MDKTMQKKKTLTETTTLKGVASFTKSLAPYITSLPKNSPKEENAFSLGTFQGISSYKDRLARHSSRDGGDVGLSEGNLVKIQAFPLA